MVAVYGFKVPFLPIVCIYEKRVIFGRYKERGQINFPKSVRLPGDVISSSSLIRILELNWHLPGIRGSSLPLLNYYLVSIHK
ncbi:MAG: hypothetical protein B1H11_09670 [Desulfobacteraceae bacterium 4484_190.1]|nr:MAG: hypothetical protein B1H11_09670 [Desulfobacteraceae bacterium 4484_190.1]